MLDALSWVGHAVEGRAEGDFLGDETLRYAVAQRLTVVGEAAARIDPEFRKRYPSVPWADIIAFRNLLVHEYFGIHWPLVWQTAIDQAPKLRAQVAEIVQVEFAG